MPVISRAYVPFIPENIVVHMGEPDEPAENIVVPFPEYVRSVASKVLYPTWSESTLRANLYAIITLALNRVYTEWYRSQGYDFDITNVPELDQPFEHDIAYYDNVNLIVDNIFNSYLIRRGKLEPIYSEYCDGVETTCAGLSQWESVELGEEGYGPFEILQYFYGEDVNILEGVPINANFESYPLYPLKLGSFGRDVSILQNELNRIAENYTSIDVIANDEPGIFGPETERAVRQFQNIFNLEEDGIVGNSTWYAIKRVYNSVKGLSEYGSEGIAREEVSSPFQVYWQEGDEGTWVALIQYYARALGCYYDDLPIIEVNSVYGPETTAAIKAIENKFDIIVDGMVGIQTWAVLDKEYKNIVNQIPEECFGTTTLYPGYILQLGMGDRNVRLMQRYVQAIAAQDPDIPEIEITGIYDEPMRDAVMAIQEKYMNLVQGKGVIGPNTWTQITTLYGALPEPSEPTPEPATEPTAEPAAEPTTEPTTEPTQPSASETTSDTPKP